MEQQLTALYQENATAHVTEEQKHWKFNDVEFEYGQFVDQEFNIKASTCLRFKHWMNGLS